MPVRHATCSAHQVISTAPANSAQGHPVQVLALRLKSSPWLHEQEAVHELHSWRAGAAGLLVCWCAAVCM